jgi:hypothetical protein
VWTHHTIAIDAYHDNTPDKALFCDHFYSDKAPGAAGLALPAFAGAAVLLRVAGVDLESVDGWLASSWASCAWSQAIPAACGVVALFAWLSQFVTVRVALVTMLALFLGGLPLPYCTMLFSHAEVAGLIGVAVWALNVLGDWRLQIEDGNGCGDGAAEKPNTGGVRLSWWRMWLAGFCLGLALASEYTAGLVVAALGVYVVWMRRPGLGWFILGTIPPLLLIPAYSWATVGSPFALPYTYQASFPAMKEGLYAIGWPDGQTAFNLLFSPARGLIFWSPFLMMAGLGYPALFRRSAWFFWFTYAVPLLQVVVISGRVWDWTAGPAFGARLLAPMIPMLALPCAVGFQKYPRLGILLASYSILITTLATITDACPDDSIYNPLTELHLPKLLRGEFSYTLGTEVFGLPPWLSVALYYGLLVGGIAWLWRLTGRSEAAAGKPGKTGSMP